MPVIAIIFGILLDLLGIGFFVGTGASHFTALIPSAFGTIIFVCGILAHLKPGIRKHAMHVAALFGLLGALGGFGRGIPKLLAGPGADGAISAAVWASLSMGLISLVFLVFCVRSFIDARLARKAADGPTV